MTAPLRLRGVCRALGGNPVLTGVDLDVEPGSVHALVGLNGAGKTTLMRIALGMLRPDRGDVAVLGDHPHGSRAGGRPDWGRVGALIEIPVCYGELTARENLWVSARLHGYSGADADRRIGSAIADVGLTAWADRRGRTLSLGTRQKMGLAAALLPEPDLLVLDEPANALDPLAVVRLRELLRRATDRGCGVLLSSHHLDELARWADRISVLNRGRIIGGLDPSGSDLERAFFDLVLSDDAATAGTATGAAGTGTTP